MIRAALLIALLSAAGCAHRRVAAADATPVTAIDFGKPDTPRLLRGFYPPKDVWRWTAPSFAVSLDAPQTREKVFVVLDFTVPMELLGNGGSATIATRVNGFGIGEDTYTAVGHTGLAREIPAALLKKSPLEVEFSLNREATAGPDGEPRGVIVLGVALQDETRTPAFRDRIWKAGKDEYRRIYGAQDTSLKRLFHEAHIWDNLQFLGVPVLKNPLDLWMVQDLIHRIRPDFIVETGTFRGGSALFWAHTLDGMGLRESRVLTVDIADYTLAAAPQPLWRRYVDFYLGSSTGENVVRRIAERVQGKKVIVMLDSNHEAAHVLAELKAYAPMVSRGSYLIVEDTHMDGVPTQPGFGPGPFAAATEFLRTGGGRDFERDFAPESFGASFNPGGWLRRK